MKRTSATLYAHSLLSGKEQSFCARTLRVRLMRAVIGAGAVILRSESLAVPCVRGPA